METVAKKPKTAEHRKKISRPGLGMLQNIHTKEIIRVPLSDERFNSSEWIHPRKLNPEKRYKCEHCDIITTASVLKQWHNEKCKHRKIKYED